MNVGRKGEVRYQSSSWLGRFLSCVMGYSASELEESLADHRRPDGGVLRWEVEEELLPICLDITARFRDEPVVRRLAEELNRDDVELFLEKAVKEAVEPAVRTLVLARHLRREWDEAQGEAPWLVLWREEGLAKAVKRSWVGESVRLVPYGGRSLRARIRTTLRRIRNYILPPLFRWMGSSGRHAPGRGSDGDATVAIQLKEGIDPHSRSETFWVEASGLEPERILIYLQRGRILGTLTEKTLTEIESRGWRWVALDTEVVPRRWSRVWLPPQPPSRPPEFNATGPEPEAGWLHRSVRDFWDLVSYWQAFFRAHDVKLHFLVEEAGLQNVAQRAALRDLDGITVSRQRSDFFIGGANFLGFCPADVLFAWNRDPVAKMQDARNRIPLSLVSGFVYDRTFPAARKSAPSLRAGLSNDVEFVVGIFDNVYRPDAHCSRRMMQSFYETFLNWAQEDKGIGLLVKPKKLEFLSGLKGVPEALEELEGEGRCVVLGDRGEVLPTTVAAASDISVGIGISSAITEALIAGERAVYCDLTRYQAAPQYRWGLDRVLFTTMEGTLDALKRFRRGEPRAAAEVGLPRPRDLDQLDPFRDEQAHRRVGKNIGRLLRRLQSGCDPEQALSDVAGHYASDWDTDKVIFDSVRPTVEEFEKAYRISSSKE